MNLNNAKVNKRIREYAISIVYVVITLINLFFFFEAISCGHPGVPVNAVLSGEKFMYGSKVHYFCTGAHILIGNATRVCQENSRWSGTLPRCSGTFINGEIYSV